MKNTVLDMTTHNDAVGNVVNKLKRNFIGIDINLDNKFVNNYKSNII